MQKTLALARKSGSLDLSNRNLLQLDPNICDINKRLGEDEKWWEVSKLKRLLVAHNQLKDFPPNFNDLGEELELLDLTDNQLSVFCPDTILDGFPNLREVRLSRNKITSLTPLFFTLPSLCTLHMNENQLTSLPDLTQFCTTKGLPNQAQIRQQEEDKALPPHMRGVSKYSHHYDHFSISSREESQTAPTEHVGEHVCPMSELVVMKNRLASIPDSFFAGMATSLKILNLSSNRLTSIPPSLALCINLEELVLSTNLLSSLPQNLFFSLPHLRILKLNENRLGQLPPLSTSESASSPPVYPPLVEMDISCNHLTSLPAGIENCSSLTAIRARDNKISQIPGSLTKLQSLALLDMAQNALRDVPPVIGTMKGKLTTFMLEANTLKGWRTGIVQKGTTAILDYLLGRMSESDVETFETKMKQEREQRAPREMQTEAEVGQARPAPKARGAASRARTGVDVGSIPILAQRAGKEGDLVSLIRNGQTDGVVDLKRQKLCVIPSVIVSGCGNIRELRVDENGMKELKMRESAWWSDAEDKEDIPFDAFTNLADLSACQNMLTTIPASVTLAPNLKSIALMRNKLVYLPNELFEYPLRSLDVSANPSLFASSFLPSLPSSRWVSSLSSLNISFSQLTTFPREVLALTSLATLDISNNKIDSVPPAITQLSKLETLNVSNNQIKKLCVEVSHIPTLSTLLCDGNPLVFPRRAILNKGSAAIIEFLQKMTPE
ncbi:putative Leucine-rich repeat protein SHOC-2 [Blattamonas nauphoetae]|uniref:Leucine-rich repeat protein SHOC-2 n=1 Tax=Blattamonas nauphoetae TaxID=2049346 RepID=A0ABQ9XRR2_9EUKA|nr:putative Leucine-rich repeat protein SHOC-2 [Blattamonas nauphoetae]